MIKMCFVLAFTLFTLVQVRDAGAQATVSVTGVWEYTIETPQGEQAGILNVTDSSGVLVGVMAMDDGRTLPLTNVNLDGDTLSFEFDTVDHGSGTGEVTFGGEAFEGQLNMHAYGSFPINGTRKPAESVMAESAPEPDLSTRTPLGDLFKNELARAVVEKHVPGLTTNPQIDQALHMSLREIAPYAPETFTDQVLQAIDEDLGKL